jgi:para-aminobenzoate synthetase component 1
MLSDQGDISLNLIIRSMLILGDNCYTQTGGGIVIDSTPEYEYKENYLKARALLDLLS